MSQLSLALDPGSSLTKVVYRVGDGEPKLLALEPECIEVPSASISQIGGARSGAGVVTPSNDTWLQFKKTANTAYAFGCLARQFDAEVQYRSLKFETTVHKFLACVGIVAEQEQLDKQSLVVRAAILLPYGEYANRDDLKANIHRYGKSYYFRGTEIRIELTKLLVAPEGGGFVWDLASRYGEEWLVRPKTRICVVMIGHRNASVLTYSQGQLDVGQSATSDCGFIKLVDKVIQRTPGQERDVLTRTICEIGSDVNPKSKFIRAALRANKPENLESESRRLAEAIKTARKEYWELLRTTLEELIPREVSELAVSGGGASYVNSEIFRYLEWAEPTLQTIKTDRAKRLFASWMDKSFPVRFADIWAMFDNAFVRSSSTGN